MAEKRMFAKSIVLSDAFLDMPMSARCLYFTLGMLADDDGFVGNPKSIMRQCGATDDDMKVLLAKRYVLGFQSGVIVIKHWRINNYLKNDRHKDTTYVEEMKELTVDEKGSYTEKNKSLDNTWKTSGEQAETQNRLDKNRLDKNSIEILVSPSNDSDTWEKPCFAKLPLLNNQYYLIYEEDIEHYKEQFPALDIEQEVRNAIAWMEANPKNRKKNGKRFITNWLIRKQERARAYSTQAKKGDEIYYEPE